MTKKEKEFKEYKQWLENTNKNQIGKYQSRRPLYLIYEIEEIVVYSEAEKKRILSDKSYKWIEVQVYKCITEENKIK